MSAYELPEIATQRTLVRHERGTMLLLIALLFVVIVFQAVYLVRLFGHEQLYSTPDIYREQTVDIQWGGHGQ